MTPQDQLDYALGQLDDTDRRRVEAEAARDPALAESLDRMRTHLRLLLDDGDDPLPPADLVRRTILRVEIDRRRRRTILDFIPNRVSPRWADVAVAASIIVAGLLSLLPAVQRSQLAARTAACTENLRVLGIGLNRYATTHQGFPYPESRSNLPYAGMFVVQLKEAGLLDDGNRLDCPVNGRGPLPSTVPCIAELTAMESRSPRSAPCIQHNDYAYSLGFRHNPHNHPLAGRLHDQYPLLADKPPHDHHGHALDGNSRNHHGTGQNVLFVGGHVRFITSRQLGQDRDLYRNDLERMAPGLHRDDFVLAPGITRVVNGN